MKLRRLIILSLVSVGSILFSLSYTNQCFSLLVFVSVHKVKSFFFHFRIAEKKSRVLLQHPYLLYVTVRRVFFCNQYSGLRGKYL